ncbi:hypothetical protein TNCV_4922481 [Trichonephila clavipes]|nr:hypothetical protein TNCV_4922481 [Trichonephila clavipes]
MGNVLLKRYVPIGIRRGKGPLTNAAVARMILKFEATGCLDDRPRSGRPSTLRNDAGRHWETEREAFLHPISRLL